jgi:hypothetical protein
MDCRGRKAKIVNVEDWKSWGKKCEKRFKRLKKRRSEEVRK